MGEFAFAFMDCEFGGLDPERHDITEVAVVLTDYRLEELASAEWKIAARADRISPEAAQISGYTALMLPADSVYIDVPLPSLMPGQSFTFPLLFTNLDDIDFSFDVRVLAGPGSR